MMDGRFWRIYFLKIGVIYACFDAVGNILILKSSRTSHRGEDIKFARVGKKSLRN